VEDEAEEDPAEDEPELLEEDEPGDPTVDDAPEPDRVDGSGVALPGDAADDPPLGARVTALVTVTSDEVLGLLHAETARAATTNTPAAAI